MAQEPLDAQTASTLLGRELATAIVMFHEAVGKLVGLSSVERKCIDVLQRLGPVTAGAVAEHTGLSTGAVTGLVDRLENAGHVERVRDPGDRRRVLVRLRPNPQMDALMGEAFGPFIDDMTQIMTRYDESELHAIIDWVRRTTDALVANTRRITGRPGSTDSGAEGA
jgi:predicted ArsR family transcriptional regulator